MVSKASFNQAINTNKAVNSNNTERVDSYSHPLAPRGMSREIAAMHIGVSASLFDIMVKDGRMPKPAQINARVVWDRFRIENAFEQLFNAPLDTNPWDKE